MPSPVKLAAIVAALVLLPSLGEAGCYVTNLRYEEGEVRWDLIAGAERYQVQESFNEFVTSRNFFTKNNHVKVDHRLSASKQVQYRVTAEMSAGVLAAADVTPTTAACTSTLSVDLSGSAEFRKLTARAVLPVVGSTPGAFGGRFKTYLKLTASDPGQKGRIVFHPAGRSASDSDPSMPYNFASLGDTLVLEDVVAELGQSGLGSLDIIPDESAAPMVPVIEARLFNDTASGTFGTSAFPVFPFDYLRPDGVRITIPDARFRVNVGFRTLTETTITVLVYGVDRRLRHFRDFKLAAGWMQLTSAADVAGSEMKPGESMLLTFSGVVVPFYTVTENRTNDPTLIVAPPRNRSLNVGEYVD